MKRHVIRNVMLVMLSALLLTGCGSGTTEDEKMSEDGPITREKTDLAFRTIEVDEAPDRVRKWIEKNQSDESKKVFHADGKTYVVIILGQKSTGGYAVNIEAMELSKVVSPDSKAGQGTVKVTYNVVEPEQGSINIQVLTYPMAIAEIDGEKDYVFQFKTSSNANEMKGNKDKSEEEDNGGVQPEELTSGGDIKDETDG